VIGYIQISKDAYSVLQSTSILTCDKKHFATALPFAKHAYRWMMKQMDKVGIKRPNDNCYPLWCWIQNPNNNQINIPLCKDSVFIQFEINPEDILLSWFELYHNVINRILIAYSEKEYDEFYEKNKVKSEKRMGKVRERYECCLCHHPYFSLANRDWFNPEYDDIQGAFYTLTTDMIISVMEIR
jgi:hypothetical protein